MKMTDGKKTIEIRMATWDGNRYSPDLSNDFFEGCQYDRETDIYKVDDVEYCIDQAKEWEIEDSEKNVVLIDEL